FSYTDTQLSRLGNPNFHEIPINRSVAPVHNNQRDAHMRQTINTGKVAYEPNSLGGGCPYQASIAEGGFHSHEERVDAKKVRARSSSFHDHFSQATLFFNSQSEPEKNHIINAIRFELGKVETPAIRLRMLGILSQIDKGMARKVADALGLAVPAKPEQPINHSFGADTDPRSVQPRKVKSSIESSAALSMANTVKDTIKSRCIAALISDGFDGAQLAAMKKALTAQGAQLKTVATRLGEVSAADGKTVTADFSLLTTASVLFDAVFVPGGAKSLDALAAEPDAIQFVNEAYKHCKAICSTGDPAPFLSKTHIPSDIDDKAVILTKKTDQAAAAFIKAIAEHRNWERETARKVPA
ncbi:MAG: catalase-related domain-containing protein, partial [Acidobacteriota bacterium]